MKKVIWCISLVLPLYGCTTYNARVITPLDLAEKTVTVPVGSKGLKGDVKELLAKSGWKLMVGNEDVKSEGSAGESVDIKHVRDYGTRYRMLISSRWYDRCMNGSQAYNYEVSMIDNKSSIEVFTMDGHGCAKQTLEQMESILTNSFKENN